MGSAEERLEGQGLGIYHQQLSDNLSMFIKRRSAHCGIGKEMKSFYSKAKSLSSCECSFFIKRCKQFVSGSKTKLLRLGVCSMLLIMDHHNHNHIIAHLVLDKDFMPADADLRFWGKHSNLFLLFMREEIEKAFI